MPPSGITPAFIQQIEAGIDSLRTDSLRHGHPRVWKDLHLLAQTETHFPASPIPPCEVTLYPCGKGVDPSELKRAYHVLAARSLKRRECSCRGGATPPPSKGLGCEAQGSSKFLASA
jgi:hypothetical protein